MNSLNEIIDVILFGLFAFSKDDYKFVVLPLLDICYDSRTICFNVSIELINMTLQTQFKQDKYFIAFLVLHC